MHRLGCFWTREAQGNRGGSELPPKEFLILSKKDVLQHSRLAKILPRTFSKTVGQIMSRFESGRRHSSECGGTSLAHWFERFRSQDIRMEDAE